MKLRGRLCDGSTCPGKSGQTLMKLRERIYGLKHTSRGVRPDPDEAKGEKV